MRVLEHFLIPKDDKKILRKERKKERMNEELSKKKERKRKKMRLLGNFLSP